MENTMQDTGALMYIVDRPPLIMTRGEGSWLWDHTGKAYLDFVQGWAVNSLGHSPRVIIDALQRQAEQLINPSPAYYNGPMVELAVKLTRHSVFDRVFFANCGAEANEGAIKLARKWGQLHKNGAYKIITMEHAFHGRTLATMSASGKPQWRELYEPKVPGFPKVDMNDLDAVARAIDDKTVGIMLEPIQGEAGVYSADDAFLHGLRRLADEHGLLLIFDEVQTGVGRTGTLFAYEQAGVEPDIMTLAKGLGAGVPLAALLAKERVCCFVPGDQGGTFCGTPLMTAVGCAVLDAVLAPGFLDHVNQMGAYLTARLQSISAELGLGEVRGRGLLLALNLRHEISKPVVTDAMEAGLLVNAPQPDSLRFMPALNVTTEEIDRMLAILHPILERHVPQS